MKIYYHHKDKLWTHHEPSSSFHWGHFKTTIPFSESKSNISYDLNVFKKYTLGPIVGVLSNKTGNFKFFTFLFRELIKSGYLLIVYTPSSLLAKQTYGYIYCSHYEKWLEAIVPLPNVVYNRIPNRRVEKLSKEVFQFLKEREIPFFNSTYFNKWDIYNILSQNNKLSPFLPQTYKISTSSDIIPILEIHDAIFLKPDDGSIGKGLILVERTRSNCYVIKTNQHDMTCSSNTELFASLKDLEIQNYIVQEAIYLDEHEGCKYDFRILAHKRHEEWKITGIGIRRARKNGFVTHIPNGGDIINPSQLERPPDKKILNEITKLSGQCLEDYYDAVYEISLDIGRTKDDHYYLFEVNSKPMIFDEKSIRADGLIQLQALFKELSHF